MNFEDEEFENEPGPEDPSKVTATVTLDAKRVERAVAELAREMVERASSQLLREIKQQMLETVDTMIRELGEEIVKQAVRDTIAGGWQKTNGYGEPTGKVKTMKERVVDILESRGQYSSGPTVVENVVQKHVEAMMSKEFTKEVDEARSKLRKLLDEQVTGKFAATLKEAIGLR